MNTTPDQPTILLLNIISRELVPHYETYYAAHFARVNGPSGTSAMVAHVAATYPRFQRARKQLLRQIEIAEATREEQVAAGLQAMRNLGLKWDVRAAA